MIDHATRTLVLQTSALALRRVELRVAMVREADPARRDAYTREWLDVVRAHSEWRDRLRARLDG